MDDRRMGVSITSPDEQSRPPMLEVRTTGFDKLISWLSPRLGMRRYGERFQEAMMHRTLEASGYVAGGTSVKSMQEWYPHGGSPNEDHLPQADVIRSRSRDLVRNDAIASGATNTTVTSVVGSGLKLHAAPDGEFLGLSEDEVEAKTKELERIWRFQKDRIDYEGDLTDAGLQELVVRGVFESGDILAVRRRELRPDDLLPTKVQLIEADRVSNPDGQMDTLKIAGGVEVDLRSGRTLAYHVATRHPGEIFDFRQSQWRRVRAMGRDGGTLSRLLKNKTRPGQRRGVPHLAPVIEPIKQLGRWRSNEITAAVVNSLLSVFVKTDAPADTNYGLPSAPEGTAEADKPTKTGDIFLSPGAVIGLRPGEAIETVDPKRPNNTFDPFFRAMLQMIGASLQIPYEVLLHLYQSSYSASRAAMLDAWRFFNQRRVWLGGNYLDMVYEWVITDAVIEGLITLPGYLSDPMTKAAWLEAAWVGDAMGQVNPKDETVASILKAQHGLSSLTIETQRIHGRDWDEVQRQRAYEKRREEEDGTRTEAPPSVAMPTVEGGEGGSTSTDTDDSGADDGSGENEEAA